MDGYSDFALFYDAFTGDVDYQSRAKYFDGHILSEIGERKRLLDLACGTGSLSVEFSKLGYSVTGVDSSVQMLTMARQKADMTGQQILFLQQFMQELDLYMRVDACVCALDSLNHLADADELANVFRTRWGFCV